MSLVRKLARKLLQIDDSASLLEKTGLFDRDFYRRKYPDVAATKIDALSHFIQFGAAEKRDPNPLFSTAYYYEQCPDLVASGLNPVLHYVSVGALQGKNPNPLFDSRYYLQRYPDVAASGANPLAHYLQRGAIEGRDPSANFRTLAYLEQHPELAELSFNPLAHYLRNGAQRDLAKRRSLQEISGSLNKYYMVMREIEPALPLMRSLEELPAGWLPKSLAAGSAYFKLAAAIDREFSHLLLLAGNGWGGSEVVTLNFATAIYRKLGPDAPLVLCTDKSDRSIRERFPVEIRVLYVDDYGEGLSANDRVEILARLILQAKPKLVHNFESRACWVTFRKYGRQLRLHSKLMACLYTYGRDVEGVIGGYAVEFLNACMDNLNKLITDTAQFRLSLIDRYAFESYNQEKFCQIYHPVTMEISSPVALNTRAAKDKCAARAGILWASRLDKEKRPDLLLAIAKKLPEIDFHVYGSPVLGHFDVQTLQGQHNLILHGHFTKFGDLPTDNVCLFLYTSEWDGMPNVLLEATARGLPVVAPNVGGIGEFVTGKTGWLVADFRSVEQYVTAIKEALDSPEERLARALAAQAVLKERHTMNSFERRLQDWGDYL